MFLVNVCHKISPSILERQTIMTYY